MKDLLSLLRSLGLLESEIKTYLAAFEQGAGTVLNFTKITKLSRQATYIAIETLTKRGLMSSVLRGKKRYYAAEHPDKLLAFAKRRENELKESIHDLERAIPELELQMGGKKPVVKVFEGKEGIRGIIEELRARTPNAVVEISDLDALYTVLKPEDLSEIRAETKKIKGGVTGLYSGTSLGKNQDVKRVILPKKYADFRSNIGLYGNKLVLITFEGKMFSVMVESPAILRAMKILFELAIEGGKHLQD